LEHSQSVCVVHPCPQEVVLISGRGWGKGYVLISKSNNPRISSKNQGSGSEGRNIFIYHDIYSTKFPAFTRGTYKHHWNTAIAACPLINLL